jgi:HTH-type transcriptional regulator, sugar sensing transcriptional regulator
MLNYPDLELIGLTKGESKVYAALLELGPSTVGPLLKRAKVAHSNIYEILDRMLEKGVAAVVVKNGVKQFQAVSPVNLQKYLDKKQAELDRQRESLTALMPRIKMLENTFPKQEALLFIGLRGLASAYKELFEDSKKGDENLWIYMHDKKFEKASDKFYMHTWMELAKNIKSKGIADPSYRNSRYIKQFKKKYEMRFADFPLFSHGEVFQDKFLLVSWEDPVISVLVKAKHVSDNFRKYFYSVWQAAKK